ncbi:MAG: M56 family metallopeptidase [candidate division KSB1 bacterium]
MSWLDGLAEKWWPLFALHMLEIALFLLALVVVERAFKLNITTRHALWLLGLAKIFVPPIVALPLAESAPALVLTNIIFVPATLARHAEVFSPYTLLLGLWASSAVLFLGLMIKRHWHMQRNLHRAKPITAFANLACPAFETERIASPMLFGLLRPKLYLPQDWRTWSPQQLQSILQHEAAHLHGRDLWTLGLESLALILFGLNPLVWFMHRRLTYLRELRCDLAAIAHTGIAPLDYGKLLYAFAEKQAQPAAALAAGIPFAAQQTTLYQRLQHLLTRKESDMNANKFGRIALLGFMGAMMLVFSWQCRGPMQVDKAPLAPETQSQSAAAASEFDTPPEVVSFAGPQYPEAAKAAQVQGMVFVQMELDTEGNVAAARILRSRAMTEAGTEDVEALGYGLEEAALAAARAAKFKPAMKAGQPQRVTITMPFSFKLDHNPAAQLPKQEATTSAQVSQPFDQAPEMLRAFDLKYPELMRKAGIAGTTYLEIGVSAAGETEAVAIAKSSGNESLDQAALAAARVMKWKPAYYQNKPVAVKVVLPAQFKLSE